jgi:hypothetical protein
MLDKPLEQVTLADLEDLIREQSPEGKTLDYKSDMYGRTDSEKKELLKDVSSFANTTGGDLIIGVDEENGIPTRISGVAILDIDAEKLRLEETIRRGIEPRIDFAIHTVGAAADTTVFVIRVRESWIFPHRVVYQGQFGEFWARHSGGKYSMDTSELRRAFNLSESIYERVRDLRRERIAESLKGNCPIPMKPGVRLILHLMPLESFRSRVSLDVSQIQQYSTAFPPIGSKGWEPRLNFDGIILVQGGQPNSPQNSYTLLYRNGVVEAAIDNLTYEEGGRTCLSVGFYEGELLGGMAEYLKGYRSISIRPPIWGFLTLTGVKGITISYRGERPQDRHQFDRDVLELPEFVIADLGQDPASLLRPSFDLIWNAVGLRNSFNFDSDGNFRPK